MAWYRLFVHAQIFCILHPHMVAKTECLGHIPVKRTPKYEVQHQEQKWQHSVLYQFAKPSRYYRRNVESWS